MKLKKFQINENSLFSLNMQIKKQKKITKKQFNICLLILIVSGLCSILLLQFYTIPNETIDYKKLSMGEYLNLYYKNNHAKFNYFQGLWLMPIGVFMSIWFLLMEIPNIKIKRKN